MQVWLFSLILIAAAIFLLDRLLLVAERRGWIRYRQSRAAFRPSLGNALSQMDVFYNPQRQAAIELTQEQILRREEEDEGDGGPPSESEQEHEEGQATGAARSSGEPAPSARRG